ncbi:TetR/AcrR family transcriptional regulator [Actinotalea sp. K2]|uniref:TetR/AcrR family transcriptional regulator n=1 Tax=Actinotalea sp. K2 TaxID=2939438 RepID=UPI0020175296|nr:TetR/AcrR family transcriptional regulator [Actinotalea sp. K2]MCL3859756.1 TetR/AcrR family transcriptional regulator [Actinotalea sp. K2]
MNLRQDVRRNRAKIVQAATDVFRESGAAAPLDLVAQRAVVGRGTLYRHFPDRSALLAAVLEKRVETLEEYARTYQGEDLLERLIVEICWFQVDLPGLVPTIRALAEERQALDGVVQRTQRLLAVALERARHAGAVRPGTSLVDAFLVIAMLDGVITAQSSSPLPAPVERALELALRGLRPESRGDLPIPVPELRLGPGRTA